MLVAGALGSLVAFLLSDKAGALVAFGIGVFPTTTIQAFVQAQAAKKLDLKVNRIQWSRQHYTSFKAQLRRRLKR